MARRFFAAAGLLALFATLGLTLTFTLTSAATPSTVTVTIPNGAGSGQSAAPGFSPENITIVIGVNNTVTWNNADTASHTVIAKTQPSLGSMPASGSGNIAPGQSYTLTFTVPGTYTYYCSYHSWMAGGIIVKELASTSTTSSSSTTTSTTPEFPTSALAAVLLLVVAAVAVAASRVRPRTPSVVNTGKT
ncbi:MAG TPA: cupredoxin domain-containing protein [Nitrososphaerales archaeon]|nr:cupredoxin domain-containing protein [Nitrososphaerales archaeon]